MDKFFFKSSALTLAVAALPLVAAVASFRAIGSVYDLGATKTAINVVRANATAAYGTALRDGETIRFYRHDDRSVNTDVILGDYIEVIQPESATCALGHGRLIPDSYGFVGNYISLASARNDATLDIILSICVAASSLTVAYALKQELDNLEDQMYFGYLK